MVLPPFTRVTGTAILAAASVAAQAQAPQPVFKSATIHVRVDVIATDSKDQPVTDLTAADFEIIQHGVAQEIADFERVSIPAIDRKIDLKTPQPPPADAFTNAPPPPSARAFVFFQWTTSAQNIVPIKRMMTSFVSAMQPHDEIAIVYARRSDLSQDFTNDPTKLVRAINNLKATVGVSPLRDWLFAMHNILNSLAAAREPRRVIVLISEGFPLKFPLPLEVAEIFKEAVRQNIPVYTMDPRGLMAPPLGLDGHLEDQRPDGLERIRAVQEEKAGLQIVAENTNGRAFVNDWNVPQSAAALIDDNSSYYLLGFYPSPYEADGKSHGFDVKVKRAGVKVRARQSYQSESPAAPNLKPPQLIDSLGAAMPGGDLILRATAASLAATPKGASTLLTVDVDYPGGVSGRDRLDLVWIAIDPDAKLRASGQHSLSVDLTGKAPRVTIQDLIDLPKGLLTVRVALASHVTNTKGFVHVPIDVRDLTKKEVQVSAIVLSRSPSPPTQLLEISNGLRLSAVRPTTARVFSKNERLRILARVFSGKPADVTAEMSLTLTDGSVRPISLVRSNVSPVVGAEDYIGDVELEDLPAGRYVVSFAARDAKSQNATAVRATTFEVK